MVWQMAAAAVGSGLIGGLFGASAASKAAKAQIKVAEMNNALAREQFAKAESYLGPYARAGSQGFNALSDVPGFLNTGPAPDWTTYLAQNPDVMAWAQQGGGDPSYPIEQQSLEDRAAYHYAQSGEAEGRQLPTSGGTSGGGSSVYGGYDVEAPVYEGLVTKAPMFKRGPDLPTLNADTFKNSAFYNIGVDRGIEGANQGFAARGVLRSGGAAKGIVDYARERQNENFKDYAGLELSKWDRQASQFNTDRAFERGIYESDRGFSRGLYESDRDYTTRRFDERINDLFQYSGLGIKAAGAMVGAGQNMTNALMQNNQTAADARSNATIYGANAIGGAFNNAAALYGMYGGGGAFKSGGTPSYSGTPYTSYGYNALNPGYTGAGMGGLY